MTPEDERRCAAWMALAQRGDERAYADVLTVAASAARRFVRARNGNVAWVEDAVQETLVAVHRARHTYDPGRPFAPWFYAILKHRTVDVRRRESRIAAREQQVDRVPELGGVPVTASGGPRDIDAVLTAVRALPRVQRDIVEGMKLREESAAALASKLGMSVSAVKVAAHRAYRTLRRALDTTR